MANDKKPPFLVRPRFLLFVLYVIVYVGLRHREEMVVQTVGSTGGGQYQMVVADHSLPHWRRQLWRAIFSLPMVVEEEGRRGIVLGDQLTGGTLGEYLAPYIGSAWPPGRPAATGSAGRPQPGSAVAAHPTLPPPGRQPPPGGFTTDEIIENHIRATEMAGQVAGAAARGLDPGALPPGREHAGK